MMHDAEVELSEVELPAAVAAAWISELQGDDRLRWLALSATARLEAVERLEALFSVRRFNVMPKAAAASIGMAPGRFYQILRAWPPEGGPLGALGLGPPAGAARATRLKDKQAVAKEMAIATMRSLLQSGRRVRTGEMLARVAEKVGNDVSSTSVLRWWAAERRLHPVGKLGLHVALDFCPLELKRPDGRLHVAAFVVDRGTLTLLGGALARAPHPTANLYAAAASNALDRLSSLTLKRLPPAPRLELLSIAAIGGMETFHVLDALQLPKSNVREVPKNSLFGRSVFAATGERLGNIRILPGRFEGADTAIAGDHLAETSYEDAALSLSAGLLRQAENTRSRLSKLAPTLQNEGEARIRHLLGLLKSGESGVPHWWSGLIA